MADGAEQHGVGVQRRFERAFGQPGAFSVDRGAADGVRRERKRPAGMLADILENADRFLGDFRADAVAGQQCDFQ